MNVFEHKAANWIVARATILFWCGLSLSLLCIAGFSQVELRNDYRSFFDNDDPIIERTDKLAERMGDSKESAILIYRPADGNALTNLAILQLSEIQTSAQSLTHVVKTKSWLDQQKIIALQGNDMTGLPSRGLVPFAAGTDLFSDNGLKSLARDIEATPTIHGRYIARDRSSAIVVLQIELDGGSGSRIAKLEKLHSDVREIEKRIQQVSPNDRILLVGSTLFDYASTSVLSADVKQLFPFAVLMIAVTLMLLYRSAKFTAASLVLIILPVLATGGLVAFLGFEFSTLVVSALLLVGTLAVADILHIANSFFLLSEHEDSPAIALHGAIAKNFWAVTATSSTTAVGEIALLFSASPAVRVMGITVIIGVAVAWLLAIMMLPLVLLKLRNVKETGAAWLSGRLADISVWCARRPSLVLGGFAIVLAISFVGISRNHIDDSMSAWFSPKTEFRQGMDILDGQYLGLRTMTVATAVLDNDRSIADSSADQTRVKREYGELQDTMSRASQGQWVSPVIAARAFHDHVDNEGPNGLRPDPEQLGDISTAISSRALSDAGLMTQYQPGRTDSVVWYYDPKGTSTFATLGAAERVSKAATASAPERQPQLQGVSLAFANLSGQNFWSIVNGSLLAFALMTVSLMVVFGSWRLGALSMIPNLTPLIVVYGAWGFIDSGINMAAVSVFSVACGIIVDDTIHLILMYKRYRRAGDELEGAIRKALASSGTGVLATTVIIAAGFFLLGLSDFNLTAQKAAMVGGAISVAFLFDLLAMPALLALLDRRSKGEFRL